MINSKGCIVDIEIKKKERKKTIDTRGAIRGWLKLIKIRSI